MSDAKPSLANLRKRASSLIQSSLADNTRLAYKTGLKNFHRFRTSYKLPSLWPVPVEQIVLYIAYCFENNYSPATIKLYISGLSYIHKINGQADHSQSFTVRKLLEGCNRARPTSDSRAPINAKTLEKICDALQALCSSKYETMLFKVAFSLAYFGLLRVSEMVVCSNFLSNRALAKQDVYIDRSQTVHIKLRQTKTQQVGRPVELQISCNNETKQFVKLVGDYFRLIPTKAVFFLSHQNATPMTRYQFSAVLTMACRHIGLDTKHFRTHSFRIGRATDLALQGLPDETIKQLGRWSSNTYRRYIRM